MSAEDTLRKLANATGMHDVARIPITDIRDAAVHALDLMKKPRRETRQERIARLRTTYPRAYEPWGDDEDARLLKLHDDHKSLKEIAKELNRPEAAVRARLDRWLGPSWRHRTENLSASDERKRV